MLKTFRTIKQKISSRQEYDHPQVYQEQQWIIGNKDERPSQTQQNCPFIPSQAEKTNICLA